MTGDSLPSLRRCRIEVRDEMHPCQLGRMKWCRYEVGAARLVTNWCTAKLCIMHIHLPWGDDVMVMIITQRPRKSEREKEKKITIASFNEESSVQLGVTEDWECNNLRCLMIIKPCRISTSSLTAIHRAEINCTQFNSLECNAMQFNSLQCRVPFPSNAGYSDRPQMQLHWTWTPLASPCITGLIMTIHTIYLFTMGR